jgi:O-antigen/teichoic acid export membrane protein
VDLLPEDSFEYYKKSSIRGVKWTGSAEIFTRIFQFVVTVVLARLLTPDDFGLIALSLVVIHFIQLVIDFGISSALIQKPVISSKHYNSSFFIVTCFSTLISFIFFFKSGIFANLLGNPETSQLIKFLSIMVFLNGVNFLPRVHLTRQLDFKKIAIAEFLSILAYGFITISSAFILRNVWCFVIGLVSEQVILGISLWIFSRLKINVQIYWSAVKDIFNFSAVVFGTRLLNFFNINVLMILINKFFGSFSLGLFSLAYQIIDLPTQRVAKNIMKVMYPILSKLQKNPQDYKKILLNSLLVIALIIFPFFTLLFLLAEPFVLIFYGTKWIKVVPFIKILCVVGFVRSLWTGISVVSMSLGRPGFEFILNVAFGAIFFSSFFILSRFGLIPILVAFSLILIIVFLYGYIKIFNWLEIRLNKIYDQFRSTILSNVLVFILIYFIIHFMPIDFNHSILFKFLLLGLTGLILYLGILYLLDKRYLRNVIKQFVKS